MKPFVLRTANVLTTLAVSIFLLFVVNIATGQCDDDDQFVLIGNEIGFDINDLMIPAVIWLSYLSTVNDS